MGKSSICTNVKDAVKKINKYNPQLIFLDIILDNKESGFNVLKLIEKIEFETIFTTSHAESENAVRALRASAFDFLAKPLDFDELEKSISRFMDMRIGNKNKYDALSDNLNLENQGLKSIVVSSITDYIKINVSNIIYCESENVTTKFTLENSIDGKKYCISSDGLNKWEPLFRKTNIFRIHNSYMVNFDHIEKFSKPDSILFLSNGIKLPVSDSRRAELKRRLGLTQ